MNKLLNFAINFLDDSKAIDIVDIDVKDKSDVTDYMIIASGTSSKHIKSLSQKLIAKCKKKNIEILGTEYEISWVLVDLGDVLIHIMQQETRDYYQLEKLWQDI